MTIFHTLTFTRRKTEIPVAVPSFSSEPDRRIIAASLRHGCISSSAFRQTPAAAPCGVDKLAALVLRLCGQHFPGCQIGGDSHLSGPRGSSGLSVKRLAARSRSQQLVTVDFNFDLLARFPAVFTGFLMALMTRSPSWGCSRRVLRSQGLPAGRR